MRKWMSAHKVLSGIIAGALCLAIVIGGPIIINEAYKENSGYMTLWGAEEVLSYYGMIITAVIGIVGVYLTVYISNRNYRDDARGRILPFVAITVVNLKPPDPFIVGFEEENAFNEDPSGEEQHPILKSLSGEMANHLYFVIDGKAKIRVVDVLPDEEAEKIKETEVAWRRAKDGKMYLRDADSVSMPFIIENIGNGPAKNLRMGFSYADNKPFFKTEITLKQNEQFLLHIFSQQKFKTIEGKYSLVVCYEDVLGNQYEQVFPVNIFERDNNRYKNIDTNGKQRLVGRNL